MTDHAGRSCLLSTLIVVVFTLIFHERERPRDPALAARSQPAPTVPPPLPPPPQPLPAPSPRPAPALIERIAASTPPPLAPLAPNPPTAPPRPVGPDAVTAPRAEWAAVTRPPASVVETVAHRVPVGPPDAQVAVSPARLQGSSAPVIATREVLTPPPAVASRPPLATLGPVGAPVAPVASLARLVGAIDSAPEPPAARRPPTPRGTELRPAFTITQPGESLRDVAQRIYGNTEAHVRLWRANRDRLASVDAPVAAGWLLRTPGDE